MRKRFDTSATGFFLSPWPGLVLRAAGGIQPLRVGNSEAWLIAGKDEMCRMKTVQARQAVSANAEAFGMIGKTLFHYRILGNPPRTAKMTR